MSDISFTRKVHRWLIVFICSIFPIVLAIEWSHIATPRPEMPHALAAEYEPVEPPYIGIKDSEAFVEDSLIAPFVLTDIEGSSISTNQCYQSGDTRTMCFTVHNASIDGELLDFVRLTFPNYAGLGSWIVNCNYQDATDSSGYPVNMTCSTNGSNEVTFTDNETETPTSYGEITSGSSWSFCVDVTIPSGYDGQRLVNWGISGDEYVFTNPPHDIIGELTIDQCTPLMLTPDLLEVEGCNGIQQNLTLSLWNNSSNPGQVNLMYYVPSGNGIIAGPNDFQLSPGTTVTFTIGLTPDLNTGPGEIINFLVEAEGLGEFDSTPIEYTISPYAGWQRFADSPVTTMDNPVAWAVHDGGLWSVGGYDSGGVAQRYDPNSDTWITYTQTLTPYIEYPVDGCYGLDEDDHEVMVLFPDTVFTGTLQRFDITDKSWDEISLPADYPGSLPEGRWAQDVVSLYNVTSYLTPGSPQNICYISGGATQTGGGDVKNLWQYNPESNITIYLGNYAITNKGFDFHASWFVPWIGSEGSICIGGGVDFEHGVMADTQCYDIAANNFRGPNIDLGQLPEPWWGMADGWQVVDGEYQIWLANGVAQDGTLLPASAYASESSSGFLYGPMVPESLYRLEGDGWNGQFFTVGGASGGFSARNFLYNLSQCPTCYEIFTPLISK